MSVAAKQRILFDLFGAIPDPQEKLAAILEWSKRWPRLAPEERSSANRVPGCVSPVWVTVKNNPESVFQINGDAESPIVRALVCLVCEIYDETSAPEILSHEPTLLDELGLLQSLSMTRRNGLLAVRRRICGAVSAAVPPLPKS